MATDRTALKTQEAAMLGTYSSGGTAVSAPVTTVAALHTDVFRFEKASDDSMASDATTETRSKIYLRRLCKVNAISYVATTGGITASNSAYATITVSYRDSAGSNLTTIGTLTTTITSSGDITQDVAKDFVLAAGALSVPAGATITYSIAKTGSGVVVRAGSFTLDCEYI
jgi:hypothetical protein